MRLLLGLTAALATALGHRPADAGERNAVDDLKPGEWLEVPDSHMIKAAFPWPKGTVSTQNGIGVAGVMSCWSGGAYDAKRDRLLIWGGGHFAYAGNEVYAFDVNALRWERLCDPSLKTDTDYHAGSDVYEDGTPRSCHTYGSIQYVPTVDRLCAFGTCANFPAARGGKTTWAFDFEKKLWEKKSPVASIGFESSSAWDPVSERIWCRMNGSGDLLEWEAVKDAWTKRANHDNRYWDHSAAIDPVGRRYVGAGGKCVHAYDIGAEGKIAQQKLATTGPQDIVESARNPGFQYDPVLDRFVAWDGGAALFTLDPATWEWRKHEPAAGNKVTPTAACANGTYGRFRYIPSKNAYVVVNDVKQNVFIGRLSDRAAEPVPRRFAEALRTARDARLVRWVAGEVARWPKEKAGPVLKEALATRKASGDADGTKAVEAALAAPAGK